MRIGRATAIAAIGAVAFLSLNLPMRAAAQSRSHALIVAPPLDAFGASPAVDGSPIAKPRRTARASAPAHVALVDEDSPWIVPPAPPPEDFVTTGVLQCVPYARFMSGIGLSGDAWTWWDKAAGLYARGSLPEPGAVLSFPGVERMPLGHVAVVTQVLSARKILIDHANWPNAFVQHGAISRDVQVVDLSPANDWTEVRVQFGEGGPLGSIYAANGFIYGWTETGVRIAQPRFSLDYALWSPVTPSWRRFSSIAYLWAFPPPERKRAYAAATAVPIAASPRHGRPVLVLSTPALGMPALGRSGTGLPASEAFGRPLAVDQADSGPGGRAGFSVGRYVMQ
jgi:CHAP domain